MSYFKQTAKEIKMENDVRKIHTYLSENKKKVAGKADLMKDCSHYLTHCGGWNPLVEDELVKIHKKITQKYKILFKD